MRYRSTGRIAAFIGSGRTFLCSSTSTDPAVKGDAARRTFNTHGADIVWAVVDSGIWGAHPHFDAHQTLTHDDVKDLHRLFPVVGDRTPEGALDDEAGRYTRCRDHRRCHPTVARRQPGRIVQGAENRYNVRNSREPLGCRATCPTCRCSPGSRPRPGWSASRRCSGRIVGCPGVPGDQGTGEPGDGAAGLRDRLRGIRNGMKQTFRQVTYWQMKNRAGVVGQRGLGPLIGQLHELAPQVRVHLVGHSFGARLVSYTPRRSSGQPRSLAGQGGHPASGRLITFRFRAAAAAGRQPQRSPRRHARSDRRAAHRLLLQPRQRGRNLLPPRDHGGRRRLGRCRRSPLSLGRHRRGRRSRRARQTRLVPPGRSRYQLPLRTPASPQR